MGRAILFPKHATDLLAHAGFGRFRYMRALFNLYSERLPFLKARCQAYFGHSGAYFPETMHFWGSYANSNYGWDRNGKSVGDVDNRYMRRHYNGTLELLATMLEFYEYTGCETFLREELLPYADEIIKFWDQHWKRDADGILHMQPAQALETYQDVINPAPDVAGLQWTLDRLLELSLDPQRKEAWTRLRSQVPALPLTNENGEKRLGFAEQVFSGAENCENPELYAVFPFRIYGLGKPDLDMARATYANRINKHSVGWPQDDIQAACLGLIDEAVRCLSSRFLGKNPDSRFPAFWGPNFDWVPDQDHGCVGLMALQTMLLQADGEIITLLPAWPKNWDVEFKLHAPKGTIVEGVYKNGMLIMLKVTPESRAKDVILAGCSQSP